MNARGLAAVDVVVSVAFATILGGIAIPSLAGFRQRDDVRSAARLVAAEVRRTRAQAIETSRSTALRVDPSTRALSRITDGDGDGVSYADIAAGLDPVLPAVARLASASSQVSFAIGRNLPDIDGDGVLGAGSSPVRFGHSGLISFSPIGHGSSGTLFLAHRQGEHAAVRVFGGTGRVRILWFDPGEGRWQDDDGW